MSYFLPRPRRLKLESGDLKDIVWPATATAHLVLSPKELFGPSEKDFPRAMIVAKHEAPALWNSNTGEIWFKSGVFFPALDMIRTIDEEIEIRFSGSDLQITFEVNDLRDITNTLSNFEHTFRFISHSNSEFLSEWTASQWSYPMEWFLGTSWKARVYQFK